MRAAPCLSITLAVALALPAFPAAQASGGDDRRRVPGATWTVVKPEAAGYSSARLQILRQWLETHDTKAMLVAVDGQVIFEYGDVAHASKVASIRKSILSMLYGKYVVNGTVDVRKTVKELGLQEAESFLENEAHATLEHLLTARCRS